MTWYPFSLANLDAEQAEAWNDREIAGRDAAENNRLDDSKIVDLDRVAELAALSAIEYERQREAAAEQMGCRVTALDKIVERKRKAADPNTGQGSALTLPEPQPWPDAVNGAELLSEMSATIRRYMHMTEAAANATALWALHTYMVDTFAISPRLAITSPEKGSGKTTLLDILERLTWRPLLTPSIQPAGIFRVVEAWRPCLLIDEADTFLKDNDAVRGILNSGHRFGGRVIRCDSESNEPRAFNVFGAVAIAMIGDLPDTLNDRSIKIELRRAKPGELMKQFRHDRASDLEMLACRARRWADDHRMAAGEADPKTDGLFNRVADNWRPLFAIADVAGGSWPELVRSAAAESCRGGDEQSMRALLLSDIRDVFKGRQTDRLPSAVLAEALGTMEGRPWAEWGRTGKPMTANGLAGQLRHFKIAPGTIRTEHGTPKGYYLRSFADLFDRYLPREGASETPQRHNVDEMGTSSTLQPPQPESLWRFENPQKPNNDRACGVVADREAPSGGNDGCDHCHRPGTDDDPLLEVSDGGRGLHLHDACIGQSRQSPDFEGIPDFLDRTKLN
jgi:putative DNA primase/helicase